MAFSDSSVVTFASDFVCSTPNETNEELIIDITDSQLSDQEVTNFMKVRIRIYRVSVPSSSWWKKISNLHEFFYQKNPSNRTETSAAWLERKESLTSFSYFVIWKEFIRTLLGKPLLLKLHFTYFLPLDQSIFAMVDWVRRRRHFPHGIDYHTNDHRSNDSDFYASGQHLCDAWWNAPDLRTEIAQTLRRKDYQGMTHHQLHEKYISKKQKKRKLYSFFTTYRVFQQVPADRKSQSRTKSTIFSYFWDFLSETCWDTLFYIRQQLCNKYCFSKHIEYHEITN